MYRLLLLIPVFLISSVSYGTVEMVSFYFEEDSAEPTGYTSQKIEEFKNLIAHYHIQVIEVNAFADIEGTAEANKALAQQRVDKLMGWFDFGDEEIIINNYGRHKIMLNFSPYNWSRVDLYYHKGDMRGGISDVSSVENDVAMVSESTPEVPKIEEISVNTPIIIPIAFKGGGNTIQKGSQPRLEQLYNTLAKYPDLTVHIRGHVCCGNNMRISKKRAKVVYKYLKGRGISKKRMSYKGYSNTLPIVFPEQTAADRAANRRVDVIFGRN